MKKLRFNLEFPSALFNNARKHSKDNGYLFTANPSFFIVSKKNMLACAFLTVTGPRVLVETDYQELYDFFLAWRDYPETQKTFTSKLEPEIVNMLNTNSDFLESVRKLYETFKRFDKRKERNTL